MTRDEAVAIADARREELRIPPDAEVGEVERRYIQVTADRRRPGPIREALVWSVKLTAMLGSAWIAVEDGTGAIVRVERGGL